MSLTLKIVLILFGLAYLISPVDIIPELFMPFVGWIDDGVVLWSIVHLIRYGELPWFLFKKNAQAFRKGNKSEAQAPPFQSRAETAKNNNNPENSGNRFRSPHEILGVSSHATWEEIQIAYKEKIKKYHPDKVSHLGDDFIHLAGKKFLEIQKAYETLKANR
jgi:uncharacterized membrane protein YkvA (DUF1232 family)